MRFEGKTALITGGTRGIGAAVARRFFQEGANIAVTYAHDGERAQAFEKDLGADPPRRMVRRVDAADIEGMKALFDLTVQQFGRIDILVNNAGIRRDSLLMFMSEADWLEVVRVNLHGTFVCCKLALKPMIASRWGRIINMVSPSALLGREGQVNYAAAKGAVVSLTKSLAKELGKTGITVNAVSPGLIDTDMTRSLPEKTVSEIQQMVPLRRMGRAEEVSETVLFLASDAASYITGQVISVDGGLT